MEVCTVGLYNSVLLFMQNGETSMRTITQFHYTQWPDKGVPLDVYSLLSFRRRVRHLDSSALGPMLVHCSAGVGRTGTMIALDMLFDDINNNNNNNTNQVDVFRVVQHLRRQRMSSVQVRVWREYCFVYSQDAVFFLFFIFVFKEHLIW